MATVFPFRAYLPMKHPEEVASLPFDRYTTATLKEIVHSNPRSFLQVISPPEASYDREAGINAKLRASREQFERMAAEGVWERRPKALYLYRQENAGASHLGLIGCFRSGAVVSGAILGHEETLAAKEERLSAYLDKVAINAEPVNLCMSNGSDLLKEWEEACKQPPLLHFTEPTLGTHSLWEITDDETIARWQNHISDNGPLFIADGHHRVASSVRLAKNRNRGDQFGDAYFLGIAFPESEIDLLPFHRLVKGLDDKTLANLLEHFGDRPMASPPQANQSAFWLNGQWYALSVPAGILPVQWLSDAILGPVLNISDLRNDPGIGFSGGSSNPEPLLNAQKQGNWQVAFFLPAVPKKEIFTAAIKGQNMPPKSTWFEPKLLNGLLVLDLNDAL